MTLGVVSFKEFNDRVAESAVQDQAAPMCSLILLYTNRNTNQCNQVRIKVKPRILGPIEK